MALLTRLLDRLVAARFVVYLGGLLVISAANRVGPPWSRGPAFVAVVTLMCLTYFAELQDRSTVDPSTARLVAATAGVAVGAYVFVAMNRLAGVLFLLGAVLFFRAAVRARGAEPEESEEPQERREPQKSRETENDST